MLTSKTFLPESASAIDTAVDTDVLPTPPLPVKNKYLVGVSRRVKRDGIGFLVSMKLHNTSSIIV